MSTRATYEFKDNHCSHFVYVHHDGYPSGAAEKIKNAIPLAWKLPRFEADEFAASFVAANKDEEGGVRLTSGHDVHGDTEYMYVITANGDDLLVEILGGGFKGPLRELSEQ